MPSNGPKTSKKAQKCLRVDQKGPNICPKCMYKKAKITSKSAKSTKMPWNGPKHPKKKGPNAFEWAKNISKKAKNASVCTKRTPK